MSTIRLGTRGSLLAKMQSQMIADALEEAHQGLAVELIIIKSSGDKLVEKPLHEAGGKGLFTKELEEALIRGEIDFAVHSFKDVPVTMPLVDQSKLMFAAVPEREDPRDVLISLDGRTLEQLPPGAKVGTSSLRRKAQVLEKRPDVLVEPIRGNIDTRIRKIQDGAYDATLLALAGLKRAALFNASCMCILELDEVLPASAQAALALQCRTDSQHVRDLLAVLNHPSTMDCVNAERELVKLLQGDCHSPIAALARVEDGRFELRAAVAGKDGVPPIIRANASGTEGNSVVNTVHQKLVAAGVQDLLRQDR